MATIEDLPQELLSTNLSELAAPAPSLATCHPMGETEEWVEEEVAGQVFRDLAAAALVCRRWRVAAEQPALWRQFVIMATKHTDVLQLATIPRLATANRIVMKGVVGEQAVALWGQVVARMEGQAGLDTLLCIMQDFAGIKDLAGFCRGVTKLRHFALRRSSFANLTSDDESVECRLNEEPRWNTFTDSQQAALFAELAAATTLGSCRLVRLELDSTTLTAVPPATLATTLGALVKVEVAGADLTSQQVAALVEAVEASTTLQEVRMEDNYTGEVEAAALARAVHRLTKVSLDITEVDHLVQVLQGCLDRTNLGDLVICRTGGRLQQVDRQLIDEAREKVVGSLLTQV